MTEQRCWPQGGATGCAVPPVMGNGGPCAPTTPNTEEGGLGGPSGAPLTSPRVNSTGILQRAQVSGHTCAPQGTITATSSPSGDALRWGFPQALPNLCHYSLLATDPTRLPMNVLCHIHPSLRSLPTPETTGEKQMQYI